MKIGKANLKKQNSWCEALSHWDAEYDTTLRIFNISKGGGMEGTLHETTLGRERELERRQRWLERQR